MGMFDNIKVETKLPTNKLIQKFLGKDFDLTGFEYQTKDLDNALLTYTIKKNGDLFVERIEYRDSTPEEKKQDIKTYGKQFGSFRLKVNSRIWEKTNHTGDVEFYAYEKAKQDGRYYTIDYKAHVVKGKVKNIKLIKAERENDQAYAERLKVEHKWSEEMRIHNEKVSKLSYKILNNIYNKPVRMALRLAYKHSQRIPDLLFKLERKILY
jgi:uncharacterized surface protein with fasciclin (FAS1) repeats